MIIPQTCAYHNDTTTGTQLISRPAGLHSITLTATGAAAVLTLYDGTGNAGTPFLRMLAAVDTTTHIDLRGFPVGRGVYLVLSGDNADVFVNYE